MSSHKRSRNRLAVFGIKPKMHVMSSISQVVDCIATIVLSW